MIKKLEFLKIKKQNPSYFIVSICTIVLTLFTSLGYKKVSSTTANMYAETQIITALSIAEHSSGQILDFGIIIPPTSASVDVVIRRDAGDVIYDCPTDAVCHGTATRAAFYATGEPNTVYYWTYTNGVLSDGTNTMTLDVNAAAANNFASRTMPADGDSNTVVGGVLTVGANQTAGDYDTDNTGGTPFTVTLSY